MNLIIDGHNLISKIPGLDLRMPDDEQRLIELLIIFSRTGRHRIEVYFDGAPAGQAGTRSFGRVRAHFVTLHSSADQAIRRRLAALQQASRDWVVVTSDLSVQSAARAAHAGVIQAEDFSLRLQEALHPGNASEATTRDKPPSEAEVQEWLAIFGGKRKQN